MMEYLATMILVMAVVTPFLCIASFIIGYNMNASRKISLPKPKKPHKPTEDEIMLQRIEKATVYKTEN